MQVSMEDVELFFKLKTALLFFVNQRLRLLPDIATIDEFEDLSPEDVVRVRDALFENKALIDAFVDENPAQLAQDECDIVRLWRHAIIGKFFVFRKLKHYTVFLDAAQPPRAYGVLALFDSFDDLLGPTLPVMVQTVLLPFKGKIVYDGSVIRYSVTFGPGARRGFAESYNEAKLRFGIITSLPRASDSR